MSGTALHNDLSIRPLTSRDVTKVRDLHSKILPLQYPPSFFLQLLLIPTRACFVAYRRTQPNIPIGFISAAVQRPVSKCFTLHGSTEDHPLVSTKPCHNIDTAINFTRPCLEILTLGVLPPYQQCGLARRLVRYIVDALVESCAVNSLDGTLIYANVSTTNTNALKFYEHIGMSVSPDIIKGLYRTMSYGSRDAYLVVGVV